MIPAVVFHGIIVASQSLRLLCTGQLFFITETTETNYKPFKRIFLTLLLIPGLLSTYAQPRYLGTKTPYLPQQIKYTAPPKGYKPVFINHVGRHGARFLTKPGSDIMVLNCLLSGKEKNALTSKGIRLLKMAELFESIEKQGYENISLAGRQEQQNIGLRMRQNNSGVFKGRGLEVMVTHKIRTQQSANAFLSAFDIYDTSKIQWIIPADTLEDVLRFYDISPAYIDYANSKLLKQRTDSLNNDSRTKEASMRICKRIFKPFFLKQLAAGITIDFNDKTKKTNITGFAQNLYDLYAVQFVIQKEIQQNKLNKTSINFKIAFEDSDLQWFDFVNSASDFYEKGPGSNALGIQVTIAVPMLVDFLSAIDSVIAGSKNVDAKIRFTHAEAISPFATLLGIPSAIGTSGSIYDYSKKWHASDIIPMSANIQWILYFNGSDYLVKMMLNEKEVAFPLQTATYPFYNWERIRQYYIEKLSKLHTTIQSDMHSYLLNL